MKLYQIHLLFLTSFYCIASSQYIADTNFPETDSSTIFYEKIFLHTDRSFYITGDDIWFKSYLVDAISNRLTDHSGLVHVELIASDSTVLQEKIVRIDNGIGLGDFQLPDTIPADRYYLRAYTRYMRNFGTNFFFTKEIRIENFLISSDSLLKKKSVKASVDVQFFPEGGSLVSEVHSNVAFKAVNSTGYGSNVSGFVISSEGDTITNFQTEHLGMGSFSFKPKKNLNYFASGKAENGLAFKTEIPSIFEMGIVMLVKANGKDLFLTIETNEESLPTVASNPLVLKGVSRNHTFFEISLDIQMLNNYFVIPTEDFPEGIELL